MAGIDESPALAGIRRHCAGREHRRRAGAVGWLQLADRAPQMSDDQRERVDERIREWAKLTPDQRRLARQNYRLAKRLDPDERQAQWERYSEMTPEQRAVLRTSGTTSNTAARHAGARTGLAKHAAQPLAEVVKRNRKPAQRPRRVYY